MVTLPELAARIRMTEMPPAGDQVLALSDMEIDYAIAQTPPAPVQGGGTTFRVERRERGGAPRVLLRETDRQTAERFVAVLLAGAIRATRGLPPLGTWRRGLNDGFAVTEDGGDVRLRWSTGSAGSPGAGVRAQGGRVVLARRDRNDRRHHRQARPSTR